MSPAPRAAPAGLRRGLAALCLAFPLLVLATTASGQEYDLYDPTVLRNLSLKFRQSDWWKQLEQNRESGVYVEADLIVDGVTYPRVGVKFKGYSSFLFSSGKKKPFKIKLDAFVPGQELYGYDSIRLNNCWTDPTFVREPVMYKLLRDYCPGTRCNFVVLDINGENWGVYVNDQQKDARYLRDWYRADTGNRYKLTQFGGNLLYWGTNPASYDVYYDSQADDNPDPWTDLIEFCDILNNHPTGSDLTDELRPIVDLDGTMWMLAINNVFCNMDSYQEWGNNFYVFHDDHHDRLEVMLHDLNMSFGTFGGGTTLNPDHNFNDGSLPLISRAFDDLDLRREYFHHVDRINREVFRWDVIEPLVLEYQALIDAEVQRDKKKLYSYQMFLDNVTQDVVADGYLVPGLKPFVEGRHSYLLTHPALDKPRVDLADAQIEPAQPSDQDPVTVRVRHEGSVAASRVELRWRTRGAFVHERMYDDGAHDDGAADDGVYAAQIPPQPAATEVEYFLTAKADDGRSYSFLPAHGERAALRYRVSGGVAELRLNEFVARNDSGAVDELGEAEDWLEIVNPSGALIDLSGLWLTDDLQNSRKWQIPSGTTLASGETLLVWCDDEPGDGPLHATFKLDGQGESVGLFDALGASLLDSFVFGPQLADHSTARLLDAEEPWVVLDAPTAGAWNQPDCGVRHYLPQQPSGAEPSLRLLGTPAQGAAVELELSQGPARGFAFLFVGFAPMHETTSSGIQLVDWTGAVRILLRLDAAGEFHLATVLPDDDTLPGIDLYLQCWCLGLDSTTSFSTALELDVCQ